MTADLILERAGLQCAQNRARLLAWWRRYEDATGREPDIARHLRTLRRGLAFPVDHDGAGFRLRGVGEARR